MWQRYRRSIVICLFALIAYFGGAAILWWQMDVRPRLTWHPQANVRILGFAPDGRSFLTATILPEDDRCHGPFRIWNVDNGSERTSFLNYSDRAARSLYTPNTVGFSPDGRRVAIWLDEHEHHLTSLKVFDAATGREVLAKLAWMNQQHPFCFSRNGKWLALVHPSPSRDRQLLSLLDVDAAKDSIEINAAPWKEGWGDRFGCLAFAADGKTFSYCAWDRETDHPVVVVWDAETRTERLRVCDKCFSSALSPDGKMLATAAWSSGKSSVKVWNTSNGQKLAVFQAGEWDFFHELVFSCDGKRLTALSRIPGSSGPILFEPLNKIITWDIESKRTLTAFESGNGPGPGDPSIIYENPNDSCLPKFIFKSQSDDLHKIVELETGKVRFTCTRDENCYERFPVAWYSLSPDGQFFATCQMRKTVPSEFQKLLSRWMPRVFPIDETDQPVIRIWNTESGKELTSLQKCQGPFAFSPDGQTLAARNQDGTLQLWDVPPRKPLGLIFAWSCVSAGLVLLFNCWGTRRRSRD
jgi:WD40 repeat protein